MLYLIEDRDYLKIGYSADIESRIKSYKTTNVYCKLIDIKEGERWNEVELHKLCKDYLYTGEWFKNCPEVLEIWNNYNSDNQYDYKKLLDILKKFSNLWNFNTKFQSSNASSFIALYKENELFINDTLKKDTPFFKYINQYIQLILKSYIDLDVQKMYLENYIKAIQSSVKCLLDWNIIESKINEQINEIIVDIKEEN